MPPRGRGGKFQKPTRGGKDKTLALRKDGDLKRMQHDLLATPTDFNFDQALVTSVATSNRSTRMGTQPECGGSVSDSNSDPSSALSPFHSSCPSKHTHHSSKSDPKRKPKTLIDPWNGSTQQDPDDAKAADSSEEEESSSEESSEDEDGPSNAAPEDMTREQRRAAAKAKKEAAIARKNKKPAAPGDLPSSSSEEEDSDDDTPANPNHTTKSRAQAGRAPVDPAAAPTKSAAKSADPSQLSRREREALQAQQARERYQKLHAEGKTDEARADLERLALVKEKREAEAARKLAEKEEREARAKEREEELEKKEMTKRKAAMGEKEPVKRGIGEGPDKKLEAGKKKVAGKGKK